MDATTRQCANRRTPTFKALLILFLCAGLVGAWVSVFPTRALADELAEEGDAVKVDEPELTAQADDFQGNIWLDGEDKVFSDSSLTLRITSDCEIEDPYVLHVYVGRWDDNSADGELLNEGEGYTYNAGSGEITLDGGRLFERDFDRVRVSAQVWYEPADATDPDTDWHLVKEENRWIEVRETRREYDREQDRDLLPGQDGFINGRFHAYVRDADHPDGMDIDCEVLDVRIISGEWLLQDFRQDNDGEGRRWYYRAGNDTGTVELEVFFQMPGGSEDSYTFKLNVSDNAYDIRGSIIGKTDVLPEGDGSSIGLPGQDIKLKAQGVQLRSDGQEFTGGFTYDWQIVEGSDCAQLHSEMVDDASIAIVHFEDYFGNDFYHRDVKVRVTASKDETSIEHEFYLEVSNEYPEIWIEETNSPNIDSNMAPGTTQQVTPQVRYHKNWSSDFCHIEFIRWIFDSNKLKITRCDINEEVQSGDNIHVGSPQAPTFTLERLNGDDCDVEIQVDWLPYPDQSPEMADDEGLRHESMRFHLNPSDQNYYDLWFEHDKNQKLFSDSPTEFRVGTNVNENDNVTIEWKLGHFEGENNEQYWFDILRPEDGYEVTGDGRSVILDGVRLSQNAVVRERGGLNVVACLVVNGHEVRSESGWAELCEPTVEYEFEQDRDMLPGWDGTINDWYGVWVQDVDHPYGWDTQYEVIDVEPISGFEHLQELHKDSDGNHSWWYYRAKDAGDVDFKVTYRDVYDEEQSYVFTVHIAGDVFSADVYVSEGDRWGLPGESVQLETYGWHWQHGDGEDVYTDTDDVESGLTVRWGIAEGGDYATLDDEGTSATLTFGELPEGEGDHRVTVEATLLYNGEPVAYDSEDLALSNIYATITPFAADFPFRSPIGATFTVEPRQLVRSVGNDDRDITESHNVHFDLRYDANAVSVEGEGLIYDEEEFGHVWWDGLKEITFTRLREWHNDINVETTWMDDGKEEHAHRDWWFDQHNYDIWFDDAPDRLIVEGADSTATLPLDTRSIEGASGLSIDYTVGTWENDDWSQVFAEGDQYAIDAEHNCVILNGQKILNAVGEDEIHVRVAAKLMKGDEQLRETDCWVEVLKSSVEYSFEHDRDLLPGWDGRIDSQQHAWVRDAEHPDGWDTEYEVTNVEVVSGAEHLEEFHEVDEGDGWYYRAKDFGEVSLKVTYTDLAGVEQSYPVNLHIVGTTYDIDLTASEMGDFLLPDSTVEVWAQGWRHTATFVEDGGEGHFEYADTTDNLSYTWEFDEGADFGTLTPDASDPKHVTLHINDLPEGEDSVNGFVCIKVRLGDGDVDDVDAMRWACRISDDFIEPYPADIDARQAVGSTQDVALELRHYVYGQDGYTTIDDTEFGFWFDDNCVLITDAAGNQVVNNGSLGEGEDDVMYPAGTFTIKRAGDWGTDIHVRATWTEHGEMRDYHRNWRLDNLDYDLWFDENKHDIDLWVTRNEDDTFSGFDDDVTNTLVLSDTLAAVGGLAYEWTVGTWENDCWDQIFGPDSGLYTISGDGKSITSNVAAMAEQGVRNLRVSAAVNLGGEHLETHNDFWFHLREREDWFDREQDRDMLPGDSNTVFRWYNHHLCNEQYPDGFNEQYEVIDVTTSDDSVVSVERQDWGAGEQADHNWRYSAQNKGTATITVVYQCQRHGHTPGSYAQGSYTFDVRVGSDVYFVQMWSGDDAYNVLPGSTVAIRAQGTHRREGQPDTDEGLTYDWEIVQGADVCKALEVDSTDPKHVTVRIKTPAEAGKMGFDDDVTVRVHLNDGSNTNVAESEWHVRVANVFQEIYPTSVDSGLCVGKSEQVKLELRQYLYGQGGFTTIGDAQFSFRFDGDCISITDEAGNEVSNSGDGSSETFYPAGTYTITRKGDWNTNVNVHAIWADRNEIRDTHRDWWFERPNQEILFTADEYKTNENCAAVVKLDVSGVSHIPDYADSLFIDIGTNWNDETHAFEHALAQSEYSVDKADDVWTITVPGSVLARKLSAWGCSNLEVDAVLIMDGEYSLWTGDETRISLTNDPTHVISHVNATAPTPTKDGVKEHYCCDNCGATFADEAGTKPVSMDDLVVVLANQVISVTNKSVAMGKTVSLDAKVTKGSGKLSYKSSNESIATVSPTGVVTPVNVGKVTIRVTAAASGTYKATSKNVTVTVTKGQNPMTVKAKTVKAAKDKKTTFKENAVFAIKNDKGKVTFKKVKGDKHIVVKKNGKVIVKKGLTKKLYKVKVKVTDAGNTNWNAKSRTITLKVKTQ